MLRAVPSLGWELKEKR
ncbi:hypothetical protein EYZ11_006742 [Aspergillus tanneri]|uniref:Uncharacterized protein n=1 Tax=Aspergillus tanneri TaxID=1220188 RepID=A0A4S3JF63_9EURO|nr:hypothetical protein EYZ11_006742 [Aspergillus tanneri]